MGQDVHVDSKTSNGAAQAAPAIVNCPLSIVNFFGFAIASLLGPYPMMYALVAECLQRNLAETGCVAPVLFAVAP
jgi:hypothetical protein